MLSAPLRSPHSCVGIKVNLSEFAASACLDCIREENVGRRQLERLESRHKRRQLLQPLPTWPFRRKRTVSMLPVCL